MKSIDFTDGNKVNMFKVKIKTSPIDKEERFEEFEVKCSEEDGGKLYYDTVEEAAWKLLGEEYPEEFYPKASIEQIYILVKEDYGITKSYPVFSEDEVDENMTEEQREMTEKVMHECDADRFLVLPVKRYSLTEECRLFMELQKQGLIDEEDEFDYDAMHAVVEALKLGKKPLNSDNGQ